MISATINFQLCNPVTALPWPAGSCCDFAVLRQFVFGIWTFWHLEYYFSNELNWVYFSVNLSRKSGAAKHGIFSDICLCKSDKSLGRLICQKIVTQNPQTGTAPSTTLHPTATSQSSTDYVLWIRPLTYLLVSIRAKHLCLFYFLPSNWVSVLKKLANLCWLPSEYL